MTGLITYPIARLLALPEHQEDAGRLLRGIWNRSREVIRDVSHAGYAAYSLHGDHRLRQDHGNLMAMLDSSGVLAACYVEAAGVWSAIRQQARECLPPPVADIVRVIVDLKRALLERMALSHWDDSIGHTFFDILGSITGESYELSDYRELG